MDAFVTALTTAVTPTTMFAALEDAAPLIVTGLVIGFSFTILRKVVSGLGKGKARI